MFRVVAVSLKSRLPARCPRVRDVAPPKRPSEELCCVCLYTVKIKATGGVVAQVETQFDIKFQLSSDAVKDRTNLLNASRT